MAVFCLQNILDKDANTKTEVIIMSKQSAYFALTDVSGKHDTKELKRELDTFPGVISVSVNAEKNNVAVDFDSSGVNTEKLAKRLEKLGYEIVSQKTEEHLM